MKIESYKTEKLKVEKDLNEMTKKSDLISWISKIYKKIKWYLVRL